MSMFGISPSLSSFGSGFGGNTFNGGFNQFGNLGGFNGIGANPGGNLGLGGFNGFPPQYNFVNAFGQTNDPYPYIFGNYGQSTPPNNGVPTFPSYLLGPVSFFSYQADPNFWLSLIGAGGVNIAGSGTNPFGSAFNTNPTGGFSLF